MHYTGIDYHERYSVAERNGGIGRLQLERFPYLIRYRVVADTVQFLSILHGARHPDTGSDRG